MPELPEYSERHLDVARALEYRDKFKRSFFRKLSNWRETKVLNQAMDAAFEHLPNYLVMRGAVKLLDLPCGAGRFSSLLARRVSEYHAADHSPHMLELCRLSLAEAGLLDKAKSFTEVDARELKLGAASFDMACCLRLIHHFQDAGERARILSGLRHANRGPLILSFLNQDSIKQWQHERRKSLCREKSRRATLTPSELHSEAEQAGYRLERFWTLSRLFSGQCVALLLPIPNEKRGESP